MRVIRTAVVLSSLLAASAVAGSGNSAKTTAAAAKGSAAKGSAAKGSGSATGSGSGSGSATADAGSGSGSTAAPQPGDATTGNTPQGATDFSMVKPEDMPTDVRMRRLQQKTQALKERAWQLKARLELLKEETLGGGVGAQAIITHSNDMGSSFRLVKLIYSLDGTQVFARTDDAAESLYKAKSFDIFSGPIAPGNHSLTAVATYRGHGYGVFEYLQKYTFNAKLSNQFTSGEGKSSKVECKGFEKGGAATPMEKRAAIECKVTEVAPEKPAGPAASPTPGATPVPPSTTGTPAPAPAPAPGK